jgi:hypothetical protein
MRKRRKALMSPETLVDATTSPVASREGASNIPNDEDDHRH